MDEILSYLEQITQPDSLGPEYRELTKKLHPFCETLQEATSWEFLSQCSDAYADVITFERKECFARGFRLGVGLMLAAGPDAPDTRRRSWECR